MIKLFGTLNSRHVSHSGQIHASRDWFILIGIAILLILLSILYNLWLVARLTSGQGFGSQQKASAITNVSVKSVDDIFATRAANADTYMHRYQAVDPSRVSR